MTKKFSSQATWSDAWAQPTSDEEAGREGERPLVGVWWIAMVLVGMITCSLSVLAIAALVERIGI